MTFDYHDWIDLDDVRDFDQISDVGNPTDPSISMKITGAKINKGPYYYTLDLKYEIETPSTIEEVHLPAVKLPLRQNFIRIGRKNKGPRHAEYVADIGFGPTRLDLDMNGNAYYIRVLETKTKEMTLEEIEKKLGHKVKIVNR